MLPPKRTNEGEAKPVALRCPACSGLVTKTVMDVTTKTVVVAWTCDRFPDHNGEDIIPRKEFKPHA
jgi:hypothetical protein